jgi:vacuolar-type H+-ATPase subunit E/Vma4
MTRPDFAVDLAPVRATLLAEASAAGEAELTQAEAEARRQVEAAQTEGRQILDDARRRGLADAAAETRVAASHARREARGIVLAAQREAYDQLVHACEEQLRGLLEGPQGSGLIATLTQLAEEAVGAGAVLTQSASGVAADEGSRHIELTVEGLARHAVDELLDEVPQLWASEPEPQP